MALGTLLVIVMCPEHFLHPGESNFICQGLMISLYRNIALSQPCLAEIKAVMEDGVPNAYSNAISLAAAAAIS